MAASKMFKMFALIAFATVAFAGCISDDNPMAPTLDPGPQVPDTAPPAAPTGLTVVSVVFDVQLRWDANAVDTDLAGYHVSRTYGGETVELTMWPHPLTTFVDDGAGWGLNVYSVVAIDESGNRSAAATVKVDAQPAQ